MRTIGIRREDKTEQERRAPLAPQHVKELAAKHDLQFLVEKSTHRIFKDREYLDAGATVVEELPPVDFMAGVKEIPLERFQSGRPHLFFSHTIKAQPYNMPLLKRVLDEKITLLDYEVVADERGRRTIFFGVQAGLAGMVNTLWSLGQRWKAQGHDTALASLQQAITYDSLEDAKTSIKQIGAEIKKTGLPSGLGPMVCGIAGYGSVSKGAQEIFNLLEPEEITAAQLRERSAQGTLDADTIYLVVFKEEDMVEPVEDGATFELQDYYDNPGNYRSVFTQYLPHLTMLVNAIYWLDKYPRLITWDDLSALFLQEALPKLTVIGDITCDPLGSIECTVRPTLPENPVYVINPETREDTDGFEAPGMQMMTVDILPAEIPRESTIAFGDMLSPYIPALLAADFSKPFEELEPELPLEFRSAVIAHQGKLTPRYEYLADAVEHIA